MVYEYRCEIRRVVDGDTVDVDIDLGFGVWLRNERVRIKGIDAPETRTRDMFEKEKGLAAKEFVEALLPVGSSQTLVSHGVNGKFGRCLGDFVVYDPKLDAERHLSMIMLMEGHATEY